MKRSDRNGGFLELPRDEGRSMETTWTSANGYSIKGLNWTFWNAQEAPSGSFIRIYVYVNGTTIILGMSYLWKQRGFDGTHFHDLHSSLRALKELMKREGERESGFFSRWLGVTQYTGITHIYAPNSLTRSGLPKSQESDDINGSWEDRTRGFWWAGNYILILPSRPHFLDRSQPTSTQRQWDSLISDHHITKGRFLS